MNAHLARLARDVAVAAVDGDMLPVIDAVSARSLALSVKSASVRPALAGLLRQSAIEGAGRHDRRATARLMLTARERDVADLLELGLSNGAMAARLGVSERTIRAHLEAMNQKLFTRSRTELLARLLGV
ncbi:LuxR C-terminal-related transcriptional regulator [Craterilacuibacter sp. RT1T]|uniref:response regulator transcription factor n=1 Tax=Craterilacuibacter sp. RT1T TaxID=2942211 RepID=UPI0020BFEED2|nr:LuxR C-terminal-related transcriptional regulator [Craterilacuibacter sp. RT1T]MCL6262168.1 LuxR C-terminal-related transcriptional regulator [Craterilacuibacter sp. RT1T]